jgi:hypothetical protein
MNATQRMAWFNLSVAAGAALLYLALLPALGERAMGGMGVLGLLTASPLVAGRRLRALMDERDYAIQRRSMLIASFLVWGAALITVAALDALSPAQATVTVAHLGAAVFLAFALFILVMSACTLVQYGRAQAMDSA